MKNALLSQSHDWLWETKESFWSFTVIGFVFAYIWILTSIWKLPYTAQWAEVSSVHSHLLAAIGFQSCLQVVLKFSQSCPQVISRCSKLYQNCPKVVSICLKVVSYLSQSVRISAFLRFSFSIVWPQRQVEIRWIIWVRGPGKGGLLAYLFIYFFLKYNLSVKLKYVESSERARGPGWGGRSIIGNLIRDILPSLEDSPFPD